ncbi:hypothetical protein EYF80_033011 [Liparis tanakae]|uniref:Uncharacterized protein n=1 Tax=Liparis tanakae TaxID=230148 RepID=A0A4Z2GVI1_9TELE|nr:hypothetical protein EYF80_033011 [Liparis tanakae]
MRTGGVAGLEGSDTFKQGPEKRPEVRNMNKESEKRFLCDCQLATQSALLPRYANDGEAERWCAAITAPCFTLQPTAGDGVTPCWVSSTKFSVHLLGDLFRCRFVYRVFVLMT